MSEHTMSSSEDESKVNILPSKDQGKLHVSTIVNIIYCNEFLLLNLRTCGWQCMKRWPKNQGAKLQLKKGKGKPPKANAKPLSADDPLNQLVVVFF